MARGRSVRVTQSGRKKQLFWARQGLDHCLTDRPRLHPAPPSLSLTSMAGEMGSSTAAAAGISSAASSSVASAAASVVSVSSTAADMMRMPRPAEAVGRGCVAARVRDTAALYLCAGTTKLVGRTLCRKAVLDPARPSITAKGRLTRTVLMFFFWFDLGSLLVGERERERLRSDRQ